MKNRDQGLTIDKGYGGSPKMVGRPVDYRIHQAHNALVFCYLQAVPGGSTSAQERSRHVNTRHVNRRQRRSFSLLIERPDRMT